MDTLTPVLVGDYSDPTVVRVGGDYYMTHSTNQYAPSLLIWHSTDLQRWTPLAFALTGYDGDVWAPEIVHHNGRYAIYYTVSGRNKVITAQRIEGPWSAPIDLNIAHIDPGHVVDTDGRRYLYLSGGSVIGLSEDGLTTVGEMRRVYDGWDIPQEWRIEGIAQEGPKLFWRDGWCYLVTAQGGTAGPSTSHMAVVARSRTALGPWENSPYNPVVRTHARAERWWSRGHGTIFDTPGGDWYILYHAYENGYGTLGRASLIQPIDWTEDGWPCAREPISEALLGEGALPSLSDDFCGNALKWQWRFYGEYDPARFRQRDGGLLLDGRGSSPASGSAPLCMMPRDHAYAVEVAVEIDSLAAEAGLLLFYNPQYNAGLAVTARGIVLRHHAHHELAVARPNLRQARLKLINDHHEMDFWVKIESDPWRKLPRGLDTSGWNHNTLGGFMSLRAGLYCAGDGAARFTDFRYSPLS